MFGLHRGDLNQATWIGSVTGGPDAVVNPHRRKCVGRLSGQHSFVDVNDSPVSLGQSPFQYLAHHHGLSPTGRGCQHDSPMAGTYGLGELIKPLRLVGEKIHCYSSSFSSLVDFSVTIFAVTFCDLLMSTRMLPYS